MRKRRLQRLSRRFLAITLLLFLILAVGTFIYTEVRGEFLLGDFRMVVEKAMSQALESRLTIGKVRGGIFYPITFSDITLYNLPEGEHKQLEASRISINYHLWDLFFNREKGVLKINLSSPKYFILPEEYKSDLPLADTSQGGESFSAQHIELNITDGSIVPYASGTPIAEALNGRMILSELELELEDINLNFYNLPVSIEGKLLGIKTEAPILDLAFESRNRYLSVDADVKGALQDLSVKGELGGKNGSSLSFAGNFRLEEEKLNLKEVALGEALKIEDGYIDFKNRGFEFSISPQKADSGEVKLGGDFKESVIELYSSIKHWPVGAVDLSTDVTFDAELKAKSETPILTGMLNTTNTIINYRPAEELSAQFTVRKKVVEILGLKWGKTFRLVGKVNLEAPNDLEIIALLDGTKLEDLMSFWVESIQNVVSGTVKGRLEVDGPLDTCVSRGHITARNGHIGDVFYENAVIHLTGKGPMVMVGDSRIYRESGYLLLDGEIDFSQLGKRNILEDIVIKTDDQSIVWEGWDISKETATDTVNLKKRIGEELEIGFVAPVEPEDELKEEESEGAFEMRYKLKESDSLKMQIREEEEFLGVEHKIKF